MRMFAIGLSLVVVFQVRPTPEAAPSSPSVAELIEASVNSFRKCEYKLESKESYNAVGEKLEVDKDDDGKGQIGRTLSFPLLFRTGRFKLNDPIPPSENPNGWLIVKYEPKPEGDQLKPRPDDSTNTEKVLNTLGGFVSIEPVVPEVKEVSGNLTSEVELWISVNAPVLRNIAGVHATIRRLDFTYRKNWDDGGRNQLRATVVYTRPAWREKNRQIHDEYRIDLNCGG